MIIRKAPGIGSLRRIEEDIYFRNNGNIKMDYLEMQTLYHSAIREISTKLEILNDEFKISYKRNPIHHMQSRLKTPQSIFEKLKRRGFEPNIESAKENLTDIAGIRVVCYYISDIYMIAELLTSQDDVTIIRQTDYIENPKPNGYRSLHVVLKVPVFLSKRKELVPIEIQIRTIGMDYWASLEHQLHYKSGDNVPNYVVKELQECADTLSTLDSKMQDIYNSIENVNALESSS